MESTNETIQRSDRDVVKTLTMEWANSRLQPQDRDDGQKWVARGVLHGQMVLLGRAKPEVLRGSGNFFNGYNYRFFTSIDRPTEWGIRWIGTRLTETRAMLARFHKRTEMLAWKRKHKLSKIWTRRQIRALKSAMEAVTWGQFLDAAYGHGISVTNQLTSCVKLLGQLAEYLPEPDRSLLDFLASAPDHVRSSYFPWIDQEVLEALT